jgi:carbon storage regulator CsrA
MEITIKGRAETNHGNGEQSQGVTTMLVLTRKANQQIQIGDGIVITILQVKGNTVRVGIDAPREVRVVRGELELKNEPADRAAHALEAHAKEGRPTEACSTATLPRSVADRVITPVVEQSTIRRTSVLRDRRSAGGLPSESESPAPARVLHLTRRSSVANLRGFVVPR